MNIAWIRDGQMPGLGAMLHRALIHPYTLFLAVCLLLWLPDGFDVGPVNDGWILMESTLTHAGILKDDATRVFGNVPRELGLRLVSGGFQGWQSVLLLLTLLRGVLFYEVVRRLFAGAPLFAIACGLVAILHPFDEVYFWVDVTGVHFALVLALASCLAALVYLQTGSRSALLVMFLFQLLACFTYSGFLLLILAFPLGAWVLHGMQTGRWERSYPLKTAGLIILFLAFQAVLFMQGVGHEARVVDTHPRHVPSAYLFESQLLVRRLWETAGGFRPGYAIAALLPAAFAWWVALRAKEPDATPPATRSWRYFAVLVAGLLALAALSYLPYAFSEVRLGARRQLFAAGLFISMLILLPLFLTPPKLLRGRQTGAALLALLAAGVTIAGLEQRAYWVEAYRGEERLLAAVAAHVPQPPPGAMFVIRLHTPQQTLRLGGFYNRKHAFEVALRFMYGDDSLHASFTPIDGKLFDFDAQGVTVVQRFEVNNNNVSAHYADLILLDYAPDGSMRVLDRQWLQQQAPQGADLSAYAPANYGSAPGEGAIICTMLEKPMRPAYCK